MNNNRIEELEKEMYEALNAGDTTKALFITEKIKDLEYKEWVLYKAGQQLDKEVHEKTRFDYNKHSRPNNIQAPLEPGDIINIEPESKKIIDGKVIYDLKTDSAIHKMNYLREMPASATTEDYEKFVYEMGTGLPYNDYPQITCPPEHKEPPITCPETGLPHEWKAKVQANFVFEQCEQCKQIRNKKKLRL